MIRFAALGAWSSAARGGGGDGRTDRGRRCFRTRWFVFNGLRDDFPALRRAARASLASRRRPIKGLSSLSPRRQAFPSFSKDFQTFPRKFQGNSKLFQGFPNFFLGRFEGNQGVVGQSSRNRVFSNFCVVSAATSGSAIPCRTRLRFNLARIPIIGKKMSAAISRRGVGARAASHAPTRKPTAATAARRNFGRERRRGAGRPRSRKSGADCGSRNWAIRILSA